MEADYSIGFHPMRSMGRVERELACASCRVLSVRPPRRTCVPRQQPVPKMFYLVAD